MTKTLLRFILLFVVTYGVGVYAFSKIDFFSSWHVFFRKSVELVVSNALPSCEIETQKFVDPVSKKEDKTMMYLVYGNPFLMKKALEDARATGQGYATMPTKSTQFKLFEMFTIPLLFLVAIFLATPMAIKQKLKGLAMSSSILFIFLLIKVLLLALFNISNARIGVYELTDDNMSVLNTFISMFSLGFSMSLALILWLIWGFRKSSFMFFLNQIFSNLSK
ncbi:MAG: hypothetical protein IPG87_12155 [Saprospiraceae bacterium]|nr:hypothetical protein [Candidatus Vicinibacter affinis]MBK8641810.1 hypothetical protein [Candidatus Vicinibacter affinis]